MSDEPKKRSRAWNGRTGVASAAHQSVRFLFGMPRLAFAGGLLSFAIGLGLTDVALDAFWPQCNDVAWIRLAGGVAALIVFLSAVKWRSRWSWPQVLVAMSLLPVIALLWGVGITWILDSRLDVMHRLCVGLTPAIAFGSAVWILRRRLWPPREHRE